MTATRTGLNRSQEGRIEAAERRIAARLRAEALELLGWAPEPRDARLTGDNYAATTGELLGFLRETNPEAVARIERAWGTVLAARGQRYLDSIFGPLPQS